MPVKSVFAFAVATLALSSAALLQSHTAEAQTCPVGRACFYAPPSMPPPTGTWEVGWDMIIASPRGTISGTYTVGTGMPVMFSVSPGMPLRVDLGNAGAFAYAPAAPQNTFNATASTYNRAEQRGIFVDASSAELIIDHRLVRGPWQSSETIKPAASGLGTRFRLSGYSLNQTNNADTGHDYVSLYSPEGATVTLAAPPGAPMPFWGDGVAGAVRMVVLARGQTIVVRTIEGCTGGINGALVTSTTPIAVSSGGRGWSGGAGSCAVAGGCGDDGADNVIPTTGIGTQYIVDDYPSTGAEGERVHVIADVGNTIVRVNNVMVATLAAGQTHTFSPNGLTFVETSLPA